MGFENTRQNQRTQRYSKLDREVEEKQQREAREKEASKQSEAKAREKKERDDYARFVRDIKKYFGRLFNLTRVYFPPYHVCEARFKHKEETYYLSYDKWVSEGDHESPYMSGYNFCLHRQASSHYERIATDHETVDAKEPKDFTARVVTALAHFEENSKRGW